MKKLIICLVLMVSMCSFAATSCPTGKHPGVTALKFVTGIGEEQTQGTVFAFKLKEAIARSARYCLVESEKDADFTFSISAIDLPLSKGAVASIAVYIPNGRFFLNHFVQGCGDKMFEQCTDMVIAKVDALMQDSRGEP